MPHIADSSEFYKVFGAVVRRRRNLLGLTQAQLASHVSLARASIANIETGRQKVLLHQLYQLADALELAPSDLLPPASNKARPAREPLRLVGNLNAVQKEQVYRLYEDAVPDIARNVIGKTK